MLLLNNVVSGFTQAGKRDPSVVAMNNKAWREYKAVYAP